MTSSSAEDLFERAPCGYATTAPDGTVLRANLTLAAQVGRERDDLVGRRFQELLSVGGRIYYETHLAPMLAMQGRAPEIAVDLVHADGGTVPALVTAEVRDGEVWVVVFEATDRRRYEQELVRARDREHAIAAELQHGLLRGDLPVDDALNLGVAYVPAVRGLEVGGDWYDGFWIGERQIGLVVGDVVGRGIAAGTTMGELRSAVRALASTGLAPGPLLEALDGYARRHRVGQMTTLAYGTLDLDSGRLVFACAGHPPPAIAAPGAPATLAWDGRSTPLDADMEPAARPQAELVLAPGTVVALYTDGLFERVDRPLQAGLEALVDLVGEHRDRAARELVDIVTEVALTGRRAMDDSCLLAVRWAPPGAGDPS